MTTEHEFDKWAANYDTSVTDEEGFPFAGYQQILDTVRRSCDVSTEMTILDLGVGTGNLSQRFVEDCSIVGVDISTEMLKRAAQKLPTIQLGQVDLLSETWPSILEQKFDRVVSSYVLHEFETPNKITILQRLAAQLSADGYFIIADIMYPNAEARAESRRRWADRWDDEFFWIIDEDEPALNEAGFTTQFLQLSECGGVAIIRPPHNIN